ncbi:hypothetical protein Poli38472_006645 [Pythium oligandrum]|uniref:TOG domain-containing protein n=1 Tax=Pythium oligandrum TaxID=41045 RepID=A0A8K1C562_PYTOL|nr:hypothetical protein Poli38472_006645 [Pythium oligandrum]|eukprot:TMW56635.1 hypothetical protein Poli38472_006645 [Pythium oligandrum]
MDGSVDTLVYQLEDDDPSVRWATLQKLRKLAAVERTHLPVRNHRRFLHCVRRRLSDEDSQIATEAMRLLVDVLGVLGDDVEQIHASILPHVVVKLPYYSHEEATTELHEDAFQVFRKYVNVANDLSGALDVLMNQGLGHGHARVREAALIAIMRLQEERYGRKSGGRKGARVDKALFISLTQAIVPALEDPEEQVVVAAEEAIAKLQFYWGDDFPQVMQYLSSEDKATLKEHQPHIHDFLSAASASIVSASVTASQVLRLRASLPVMPPTEEPTLCFGFVPNDAVEALSRNAGNTNAEWKKRTAAVEKLYAAAKQVDVVSIIEACDDQEWTKLLEICRGLLQDIDIHLVKRSLQILRLLWVKLSQYAGQEVCEGLYDTFVRYLLGSFVETAANFAEDEELSGHTSAMLLAMFKTADLTAVCDALVTSLEHRRLQIREEALKIWIVSLLVVQEREYPIDMDALKHPRTLQLLGRVLGDGSSRVRRVAIETSAVLASITRTDLVGMLEDHLDDFTLERIDLDLLYTRLRRQQMPRLLENGRLEVPDIADVTDPSQKSGSRAPKHRETTASRGQITETLLNGVSEMQDMASQRMINPLRESKQIVKLQREPDRLGPKHDITRNNQETGVVSPRVESERVDPRQSSAPTEPVQDKLAALKRKAEKLKKSSSSRNMNSRPDEMTIDTARSQYNPQEGDHSSTKEDPIPQSYSSPERPWPTHKAEFEGDAGHFAHELAKPTRQSVRDSAQAFVPPDDRPIRPLNTNYDQVFDSSATAISAKQAKREPAVLSTATRKRQDAKAYQEPTPEPVAEIAVEDSAAYEEQSPKRASARPISLATRKRMEARAKVEQLDQITETAPQKDDKASIAGRRSSLPSAPATKTDATRYLEPHELKPLPNAKQDAAKIVQTLQNEDWEVVFEGLNLVRRLAAHHTKFLEENLHAVVKEIVAQVPNLRSSVSKNALLALESMCAAYGKLLDADVDRILAILLKRCTDSNTFVCESASTAINAVITHCSTSRVVSAVSTHITSRANPIRREVARAIHHVILSLGDQIQQSKELGMIMSLVGKCLEDSSNDVRDVAKLSIGCLLADLRMDSERVKKLLPSALHPRVDQLVVARKVTTTRQPNTLSRAPVRREIEPSKATSTAVTTKSQSDSEAAKPGKAPAARRMAPTLDNDALDALVKKLESSNWKDRFDALQDMTVFIASNSCPLCESGKLHTVFDSLTKRMEDGNAKVSTLALEVLPGVIATLGNGIEMVLSMFVPALAKGLAASNAKQAALAHAALQTLCASVEARLLCQHIAAIARHANSRVKPTLLEVLEQLAGQGDDKTQYALTRYVLPVALEQLKDAKSEVQGINKRLLRTLHQTLGASAFQTATGKLSGAQQEKLTAILNERGR